MNQHLNITCVFIFILFATASSALDDCAANRCTDRTKSCNILPQSAGFLCGGCSAHWSFTKTENILTFSPADDPQSLIVGGINYEGSENEAFEYNFGKCAAEEKEWSFTVKDSAKYDLIAYGVSHLKCKADGDHTCLHMTLFYNEDDEEHEEEHTLCCDNEGIDDSGSVADSKTGLSKITMTIEHLNEEERDFEIFMFVSKRYKLTLEAENLPQKEPIQINMIKNDDRDFESDLTMHEIFGDITVAISDDDRPVYDIPGDWPMKTAIVLRRAKDNCRLMSSAGERGWDCWSQTGLDEYERSGHGECNMHHEEYPFTGKCSQFCHHISAEMSLYDTLVDAYSKKGDEVRDSGWKLTKNDLQSKIHFGKQDERVLCGNGYLIALADALDSYLPAERNGSKCSRFKAVKVFVNCNEMYEFGKTELIDENPRKDLLKKFMNAGRIMYKKAQEEMEKAEENGDHTLGESWDGLGKIAFQAIQFLFRYEYKTDGIGKIIDKFRSENQDVIAKTVIMKELVAKLEKNSGEPRIHEYFHEHYWGKMWEAWMNVEQSSDGTYDLEAIKFNFGLSPFHMGRSFNYYRNPMDNKDLFIRLCEQHDFYDDECRFIMIMFKNKRYMFEEMNDRMQYGYGNILSQVALAVRDSDKTCSEESEENFKKWTIDDNEEECEDDLKDCVESMKKLSEHKEHKDADERIGGICSLCRQLKAKRSAKTCPNNVAFYEEIGELHEEHSNQWMNNPEKLSEHFSAAEGMDRNPRSNFRAMMKAFKITTNEEKIERDFVCRNGDMKPVDEPNCSEENLIKLMTKSREPRFPKLFNVDTEMTINWLKWRREHADKLNKVFGVENEDADKSFEYIKNCLPQRYLTGEAGPPRFIKVDEEVNEIYMGIPSAEDEVCWRSIAVVNCHGCHK